MFNGITNRKIIVDAARHYIGYPSSPYLGPDYGHDPQEGFDCSGFVLYVLRLSKLCIPELIVPDNLRHANELHDSLGITVNEKYAQPADLVFFSKGNYPDHVGIYIGENQIAERYMIHSPGRAGHHIQITRFQQAAAYKSLTKIVKSSARWHQTAI